MAGKIFVAGLPVTAPYRLVIGLKEAKEAFGTDQAKDALIHGVIDRPAGQKKVWVKWKKADGTIFEKDHGPQGLTKDERVIKSSITIATSSSTSSSNSNADVPCAPVLQHFHPSEAVNQLAPISFPDRASGLKRSASEALPQAIQELDVDCEELHNKKRPKKLVDEIRAIVAEMEAGTTSTDATTKRCALLGYLTSFASVNATIAREGGIRAVLAAMGNHGESAEVQEAGCRALRSFASDFDELSESMEMGKGRVGIEKAITMIEMHGESLGVHWHGFSEERCLKIGSEGGIGAVVSAMARHTASAGLSEAGCLALWHLAANAENCVKIGAEGGIGAVIAAMRKHRDEEGVQEAGCGALWNLAFHFKHLRVKIRTEGGVGEVFAAMCRHGESARMQMVACGALLDLSQDVDDNIVSGAEGGIRTLVSAMRKHRESFGVQSSVWAVLMNLASSGDDVRAKIAAEGVIEEVILGMRAHRETAKLQSIGCSCLAWFGGYGNLGVKIGAEGGIKAVISAIRQHCELFQRFEVQEEGCDALRVLASNAENCRKIGVEGGIEAVMTAMRRQGESENMQVRGCLALLKLVKNPDNLGKIQQRKGAEKMVKGAMKKHATSRLVNKFAGALLQLMDSKP